MDDTNLINTDLNPLSVYFSYDGTKAEFQESWKLLAWLQKEVCEK